MHAGLMLSAHACNIQYYGLVKVVNNASAHVRLVSYPRLEYKAPSNQNVLPTCICAQSRSGAERESVAFRLAT